MTAKRSYTPTKAEVVSALSWAICYCARDGRDNRAATLNWLREQIEKGPDAWITDRPDAMLVEPAIALTVTRIADASKPLYALPFSEERI